MNTRPPRASSMTTSSPGSRPRPSGGLRPALTPAPGAVPWQRAGAPAVRASNKFRSLRFQGIAARPHRRLRSIGHLLGLAPECLRRRRKR